MHSSNARTYSGDPQKCSEDFGNVRYSGGFPGLTGGVLGGVPGMFQGCSPPKLAHAIIETKSKTKPIQGILRYAIFCFHENWRLTFLGVLKLISRTINKISRVAQSNAGLFRKKKGAYV